MEYKYLLPVFNSSGGNYWKMPIILTTEIDLVALKKSDLDKYIKVMLLSFQKLHKEISLKSEYNSIVVHAEYSNCRINNDFWNSHQLIATSQIGSKEKIVIALVDSSNISFSVKDPVLLELDGLSDSALSLINIISEYLHEISLTGEDLSIIIEDDGEDF